MVCMMIENLPRNQGCTLCVHVCLANPKLSKQRISARQKLNKLNLVQFLELSTDIYDEINRRKKNSSSSNEGNAQEQQRPRYYSGLVWMLLKLMNGTDGRMNGDVRTIGANIPFLTEKETFHAKRNQARQKLATLSESKFFELSGDVLAEWTRRFPKEARDAELGLSTSTLQNTKSSSCLFSHNTGVGEESSLSNSRSLQYFSQKRPPRASKLQPRHHHPHHSSNSTGTGIDVDHATALGDDGLEDDHNGECSHGEKLETDFASLEALMSDLGLITDDTLHSASSTTEGELMFWVLFGTFFISR